MALFLLLLVTLLCLTSFSIASKRHSKSTNNQNHRNLSGDFSWDIEPMDGYPTVVFDENSESSEVQFHYLYSGALSDRKTLVASVYQTDCTTPAAQNTLNIGSNAIHDNNEFIVHVDIDQLTITESVHYTLLDKTHAAISFCVRVDYNYVDDQDLVVGVNFHETIVTINVDLAANFSLSLVNVNRQQASTAEASALLEYSVIAYYCLDDNSEITNSVPRRLSQGQVLQICVKLQNPSVQGVFVEDIWSMQISQKSTDATTTRAIHEGFVDIFTSKNCTAGICNIRTFVLSQYFVIPNDLIVTGTAILGLGDGGRHRFLSSTNKVKNERKEESRQANQETVPESTFEVIVSLDRGGIKMAKVIAVVLILLTASWLVCRHQVCCCCFVTRTNHHQETDDLDQSYASNEWEVP